MSKRNILIQQIKEFDKKYFNEDQKTIAINILKNAPEQEVQAYADFLFNKRRTGFAFDYSPEIAKGRLITLREDKDRRINVDDDISEDENKLIIGDNYNALKALLITHKQKIDVIYIDPPYNTESAKNDGNNDSYKEGSSSKFIYKDKFGRTGWLNMMKDRLTLAKDLLKDDGVIFVSIDDKEQAYLKVLMDEIFEEENFVNQFNWVNNKTGRQLSNFGAAKTHEYILCYSKNNNRIGKFILKNRKEIESMMPMMYSKTRMNILNDEIGEYTISHELYQRNRKINEETSPTLCYDIYYDEKNNLFYPVDLDERPKQYINFELFKCKKNNDGIHKYQAWRWGREKVFKEGQRNLLIYSKNDERKIYSKKRNFNETLFKDTITDLTTQLGTNEVISLGIKFSMPKPVKLIKYLINLNLKNNITILDFFAGSGTTGQAVMDLNKEDNGNRKFILVTNNENNIAHDVTFERLHRIIKGEGTKQEKDFDWLKTNKPYDDVKLRVIDIDDSVKISLDQENIDDTIFDDCKNGLKLLDNEYNKKDLNLYYDLSALNPIEKIEE